MNNQVSTDLLLEYFDFGTLLGDRSTVDRLLQGLLSFAHSGDTSGTASEIHAAMPDGVSETLVEDVLGYMENAGWVTAKFNSGEFHYHITADRVVDPLIGARQMLDLGRQMEERRDTEEFELVCTLPESDPRFSNLHPVDFGLHQITSKLLEMCGSANRRIIILSPFIEEQGIKWLLPGLQSALQRGVSVDLVSSELQQGSANSYALAPLTELDQSDVPGALRIFEYYQQPPPGERYPVYALHAKVMIADRTTAYVGSANFTGNAFLRYLEIGAVLRGENIHSLVELADVLIEERASMIYPETET
ncbi:phospholipase D-like domain-containing protein [Haloarchaeobius sp. DYHT-AS-18]|uniref:phospholipase D-like domain-containing protein n=1 Tax=Haloarchaeobius sp. DYHT-AS-18 TaxID=3446117 RepID=UPI003EB71684